MVIIGYVLLGLILFVILNLLSKKYLFSKTKCLFCSILFIIVVAGFCARFGWYDFNENIFLVIVFKFIINLFYINYLEKEDFFNKEEKNIQWFILELIIIFVINQEFINKVEEVFLVGDELKLLIWLIIFFILFNFFKDKNNNIKTKEIKKSLSEEQIIMSFSKIKLSYDEDIKSIDRKTKLIIYSILVFNNYQRPLFFRKLDNIKFKFSNKKAKLGIGQVVSKKFITDIESIELLRKKIEKIMTKTKNSKRNYKDVFISYDKENSDKLILIYENIEKFCNL